MFEFLTKKEPLTRLTEGQFDKVKFKARVAFIDDEELTHIDRLRKDGYNITHFADIEKIDDFIRKEYHVIILDIQGVGKELTPNQGGWGLLRYIKQEYPHIVVIMFTGADWSITQYKDLANKADDFIGKDVEFLDFKSKLDNGIRKAFSIDYHFEIEKKNLLSKLNSTSSIDEIKRIIDTYGANESKTMNFLKKIVKHPDALKSLSNLLSVISGLKKLILGV
jgi:DNA-binding response OmpR family regulator